jgi:hypothetical protein
MPRVTATPSTRIERFDLMGEGPGRRPPWGWRSRPKRTSPVTRLYAERTANRREVGKMSGMSELSLVLQSRAGEYDIASKSMCATFCD